LAIRRRPSALSPPQGLEASLRSALVVAAVETLTTIIVFICLPFPSISQSNDRFTFDRRYFAVARRVRHSTAVVIVSVPRVPHTVLPMRHLSSSSIRSAHVGPLPSSLPSFGRSLACLLGISQRLSSIEYLKALIVLLLVSLSSSSSNRKRENCNAVIASKDMTAMGPMLEYDLDEEELRRERRRRQQQRISNCCKKMAAFLFSHIGLAAMVVAYSIMGGFLFRAIEAPAEQRVKVGVVQGRELKINRIWQRAIELQQHIGKTV
jgi:hypothetical protein